ncbi:MAG: hypothetical protein ABIR47_15445, partial [Candidatus Kapaibacterium sp.]
NVGGRFKRPPTPRMTSFNSLLYHRDIMVTIELSRRVVTISTPSAIEVDDLTKNGAINLCSALARHAAGTSRVSGFNVAAVVDEGDAPVARWGMRAGARL